MMSIVIKNSGAADFPFGHRAPAPKTAPYVPHSPTSKAAAKSVKSLAANMRRRVLDCLRERGPMTDEEMQDYLKMNPSTQRPRRIELVLMREVGDSGVKTLTRSGRMAVVWRAIP
jgi:hypothetical protein